MLAGGVQDTAQVDQTMPVELQRLHRGAACRRQAQDQGAAAVLGKVVCPLLSTRMDQWNTLARNGVPRLRPGVFVIVAPLAGERQIIR
jgi:hypothetical protein